MTTPSPHADDNRDPAQAALQAALETGFRLLRGSLLAVLAAYLLSGLYVVQQHERAVVLVFGRITGLGAERLKGPGLHWTWPKPIAAVQRLPAERVQTLETVAFWPQQDPRTPTSAESGAQPPPPTLKPGTDGYTLTGDANLLHSRWALRFTVDQPEAYLFRCAALERVLRAEFEHAILRASARTPIDAALRTGVEALRAAVEHDVRARVEALQLGLRVQGVEVLALAPPRQVAEAFEAVVAAEQERSTRISAARAYAARQTNEAQGQAARLRAEGQTYQSRLLSEVQADADYFTRVRPEYLRQPEVMRRILLQDTLRRTLARVEQKFIVSQPGRAGQEIRLMLGPQAVRPSQRVAEAEARGAAETPRKAP